MASEAFSIVGQLVLLRLVLNSISIYQMSVSDLPEGLGVSYIGYLVGSYRGPTIRQSSIW